MYIIVYLEENKLTFIADNILFVGKSHYQWKIIIFFFLNVVKFVFLIVIIGTVFGIQ